MDAMQFALWLCRVVLIMIGAGRMGKCGSMSWEPDFIFGLVVALIGIIIVLYTATQVEGDRKELFTRATSQAGELQASKERCSQLQRKLEETEKRESEQSMKAAEMKARVTSLERERDDLQQQLEEKKKQLCQKPASPGAMEMVAGFFGLLLKSSQARVHYEGSTGITGDFALGGVSFGRN